MTANPSNDIALSVTELTKRYETDSQTVVANDSVNLVVRTGALHAIVGENGAGKSTLAHCLAGLVRPDAGTIEVFGQTLLPGNPSKSRAMGVGLVAQHITLVDTLTVWENVILGDEPGNFGRIDREHARQTVVDLAASLGLELSVDVEAGNLPLPTRQGVEIIKALDQDARILVLDEPTSILGPAEADRLFEHIAKLRASGTTIILVTHRVREVIEHATAVTVLRQGTSVATFSHEAFDAPQIIKAIIGKPAPPSEPNPSPQSKDCVSLSLNGISTAGRETGSRLNDLSLDVYHGETLGLAGVAGNGQTELAEVIAGVRNSITGTIEIEGTKVTNADTRTRRERGLAYIPEDRRRNGLVGSFNVRDNLFLGDHKQFGNRWKWNREATETSAKALIMEYDIRTPSPLVRVDSLSGGNQQKVILARELSRDPRFILAVHPTHGLDLGAAAFVHKVLREAKSAGRGILLISSDLEELRSLSDRIAVIFRGQINGIAESNDFDEQIIGSWMTSGRTK
ncbi:MAG: ABC transporter ATP-binding protein [Candidatus Latescibacterota bacterium]|nr:ABC transporter ATP-binding protein [Candidatus Latescibacterota bacterium]